MKKNLMMVAAMVMSWCVMADTWLDPETGIEWTYTVSGGEASVGGEDCGHAISQSTTGAITIPATFGGYPVTRIGDYAFEDCSGLSNVTIPSSVTSIGGCAFMFCSGLTSITVPYSVTSVEDWAFEGCVGLTSINVSKDNADYTSQDGVLFDKLMTELICCPCGKTGTYVIPNSVTRIGFGSFSGCSGLTDITIPDSVTRIECWAFQECGGLTSVAIPNSVISIGYSAFLLCSGLVHVTIPSNVISIEGEVFKGCDGLTSINVSKDNVSYTSQDGVLFNKLMTELICCPGGKTGAYAIPNGVTNIENSAFYRCNGLTNVVIPNSVMNIGIYAFYSCSGLKSIVIPSGIINIAAGTFSDCSGLTSVTIPNGVTNIGTRAFYCCFGLTSVTMPLSIMSIGAGAFEFCIGLTSVAIPNSVSNIGDSAFACCGDLKNVIISEGVDNIGIYVFSGCHGLTTVDFEGAPPKGVTNAQIKQNAVIRYNVAYENEWLPVIAECGWTNATPYVPNPKPVTFVVPNGEASVLSHVYTNETYGVLPEARREGFTFAGWYTSLDGTNRVSAFSAVNPNVTALYARWVEDDASLYAQWEANRYSVSFNANGGAGEMAAQPFLYDQVQALSDNAFTKLGYTFKGWATVPDGEVVYTNGVSVSNLTAEAGFAVALFAKWEKVIDVAEEEIEEWVGYTLAPKFKKTGETNSQYRKRFEAEYGDDYAAAFFEETGKIGMDGTKLQVWHDYVAGTDPLDGTSQFKATITFDDNGVPKVEYNPKFSDAEEAAKRIYTTYGKKNLADKDWSVVDGHEADYNFFKVTVEMK